MRVSQPQTSVNIHFHLLILIAFWGKLIYLKNKIINIFRIENSSDEALSHPPAYSSLNLADDEPPQYCKEAIKNQV